MGVVELLSYAVAVAFTVYAVRQMISRNWTRLQGLPLILIAFVIPFSAIVIMAFIYLRARSDQANA